MSYADKERLISLRTVSEPEPLDLIAREAGFKSYDDYEKQMRQMVEMVMSRARGSGEPIPESAQPTFWTELL